MRRVSVVLLLIAAVLLLGVAGCGGNDEAAEKSATPAEAVSEIEEIKTLLATAVQQVRDGDAAAAEKTAGNAYLEHFEAVEGPLGKRDQAFMEELEQAISTDLRNDIKDGKSADEIQADVDAIDAKLDRAVKLLQS